MCSRAVAAPLSSSLLHDILPISFWASHQFPNHSVIGVSVEVIVGPLMFNNLCDLIKIFALENFGRFFFAFTVTMLR
jgi:hypothetical protein